MDTALSSGSIISLFVQLENPAPSSRSPPCPRDGTSDRVFLTRPTAIGTTEILLSFFFSSALCLPRRNPIRGDFLLTNAFGFDRSDLSVVGYARRDTFWTRIGNGVLVAGRTSRDILSVHRVYEMRRNDERRGSQGNHFLHKTKGAQHDIPRGFIRLRLVHISGTSCTWRYGRNRIRMHRLGAVCSARRTRAHTLYSAPSFLAFASQNASYLQRNLCHPAVYDPGEPYFSHHVSLSLWCSPQR